MKHHYWEPPIAIYLFLGGLAGGILFLSAIFNSLVIPGIVGGDGLVMAVGDYTSMFAFPVLWSLVAIALGCVCLIIDLGQPGVFWRVWTTATSIIKWGATFLVIASVFALLFLLCYLGDSWTWMAGFSNALKPAASFFLVVAGLFGLCIMMYTGIMLSTLKAHAFWATPALPVLFTISATSTGCAAIALSLGGWPAAPVLSSPDINALIAASLPTYPGVMEEILHINHVVDMVLVLCEIVVLLTMVLSFLGAGNVTAKKAAQRWVKGDYAVLFWVGMVGCGLLLPLCFYIAGGVVSTLVAPILVLCGGCLLRFMVVNTDDRAPIEGEERYYNRVAKHDAEFVKKWTYGENVY